MTTLKTKPEDRNAQQELGDETFMSADDLRNYMTEMQMAKAMKSVDGMDRAGKAREELIKRMAEPIDLTPERLKEIVQSLKAKLRAGGGARPDGADGHALPQCNLHGQRPRDQQRGSDWPETLTGRPRQAYELWRDQLKPAGFRLSAMIIEWPGGLPGDVGFFLKWGDTKR